MAIAALDLGKRRIGIAVADNDGLAVHPVGALERRSLARDLESILARFAEFEVTQVVVGLPLNMDGTAGPAARAAEAFADRVRDSSNLPVDLFDERLTSFEAEERLREMTLRRPHERSRSGRSKGDKGRIDALAASIILEGWLAHRRTKH
jgi:putative Holliday junction resolvase